MISEQQTAVPVAETIITKSSKGCHDENTVLLCTPLHNNVAGVYPPHIAYLMPFPGGRRSTEKMEKVKEKV
jgi:hypothetical protein